MREVWAAIHNKVRVMANRLLGVFSSECPTSNLLNASRRPRIRQRVHPDGLLCLIPSQPIHGLYCRSVPSHLQHLMLLQAASSRQLASCSWIRIRVSATRCCEAIFRVPPKATIVACESPDACVLPSGPWSTIRSGVSAFQNAFCIVLNMLSSPTRWVSQDKPADALAAHYVPARRFPFSEFAGRGFRSDQARLFELLI